MSRTVLAALKPVQGWVDSLLRERREDFNKDSMSIACLPLGPRYITSAANDVNWLDSNVQRTFQIIFSDGALFLEQRGGARTRLVPQSETIFMNGGLRLEFIRDSRGVATHLLDGHVSGDYKFERTK